MRCLDAHTLAIARPAHIRVRAARCGADRCGVRAGCGQRGHARAVASVPACGPRRRARPLGPRHHGSACVLRVGDVDASVAALQERLTRAGFSTPVDSRFGPSTRNAVIALQRAAGLTPDASGAVGRVTSGALDRRLAETASQDAKPESSGDGASEWSAILAGARLLRVGARGADVRALQEKLAAHGQSVTADGAFGPATQAAVVAFQRGAGLRPDPNGTVGRITAEALDRGPSPRGTSGPSPTPRSETAPASTSAPPAAPAPAAASTRANTPASATIATGPDADAFRVDQGQLTFDAEGTEGGRYHTRVAHVPPGPSGVTIGRGYDLGQHTRAQIVAALVGAGLDAGAAGRFGEAAGLKGDSARDWLRRNRTNLVEITPEQQEALFATTYREMAMDVSRISNKTDVVAKYGATDLNETTSAISDTLVDLRYRGDYTPKARDQVQKAASDNDLIGMTDAMSDRSQWKGVPEDRFRRRKAYLERAEYVAEGAAYGWSGGPMDPNTPSLSELQAIERAKKAKQGGGQGAGATPTPAVPPPAPATTPAPAPTPASHRSATAPGSSGAKSRPPEARDDDFTDSTLIDYAEWLDLEVAAIARLEPSAQPARAAELLRQVERFVGARRRPDGADAFEIARRPLADQGTGDWVPAELVQPVRRLAAIAERASTEDWNSRLGAPQYRTQSDNLAAPEATCNVTSMSMILERLGYSRADVLAALDREVKLRWLRSHGQRTDVDLSQVDLPEGAFANEIMRYLDHQNAAGKAYQRLRGRGMGGAERKAAANRFRDDAQMEDLVDVLLSMMGVDRTTINPVAAKLLAKVETQAGERPAVEIVRNEGRNTWAVAKARIAATIEGGGSAMLSIFHKGAGQSGTHLVVAQAVTESGMVLDDPYGQIRSDYDRRRAGDAYAAPGKTRRTSALRNVPRGVDHDRDGLDDDWTQAASVSLSEDERRGESNAHSDATLSKAWNYVALYRRAPAAT